MRHRKSKPKQHIEHKVSGQDILKIATGAFGRIILSIPEEDDLQTSEVSQALRVAPITPSYFSS
jgi:hypothetical protein